MKVCSNPSCSMAGEAQPESAFWRKRGGLRSWCKECYRRYRRTERGRMADRRYQSSERGEQRRRTYEQSRRGRAKKRERGRRWRRTEAGREKVRNLTRVYRERNPEKAAAYRALYTAVRKGLIPRVVTRSCHVCSRPADLYRHLGGYSADLSEEKLAPTCRACSRRISRWMRARMTPAAETRRHEQAIDGIY